MKNNTQAKTATISTTLGYVKGNMIYFRLQKSMDIEIVGEIFVSLQDLLSQAKSRKINFTLESNEVENITTPAIQLLVALVNTIMRQGGTFIVKNPSREFVDSVTMLGVAGLLLKNLEKED
ncbi:MAG: STAS domain-containing protein [Pseudomonadota bacterium]